MKSEHTLGESSAKEKLKRLQGNPQCLDLVSRFVKENKGKTILFEEQQDFQLQICGLDGTFYAEQSDMLEDWEMLNLPKPVKMEVLGIMADVPCLTTGQQLDVYPCAKDLEPESEEEWVKDPEIQQIRQSARDFESKEEAIGKHLDFLRSL
ncbi:unnamed protein product [Caretta caretta]